ncbi:hypothetical protein DMENIID0001_016800 [Sergentomyia squamirostris]
MDPFCNTCFTNINDASCDLYCTQCHHVVCKNCILRNNERCSACNGKCRMVKITKDMPENVQRYFRDPVPELETLQNVVSFQEQQRSIAIGHHKQLLEDYHKLTAEVREQKKEYDRLRKEVLEIKRQKKGGRGNHGSSSSEFSTPKSSISGMTSSQFTDNSNNIAKKVAMDESFWRSTPSSTSSGGKALSQKMSRLNL